MMMKRPIALGLALVLCSSNGCATGWKQLDREELADPEPASSYKVTTRNGRELTFVSLHVEGDWLVGTARFTSSEVEGEGEEARTNVTNRYEEMRLPWNEIETVEAEADRAKDTGVYLAAGALVVGVAAFLLLSGGEDTPTDGNGKTPP